MKYFFDTEFREGFTKSLVGKRRHIIDLISIGIVAEDGREYYAISKDFNIVAAWNSYDLLEANTADNHTMNDIKVYWLRDNVLKPMMYELWHKYQHLQNLHHISNDLTLNNLRSWVAGYGRSNKQIKNDIFQFICPYEKASEYADVGSLDSGAELFLNTNPPEFYAYYADYDWVLFCSLFGRMIDLPKGFPKYCRDLKQTLDERLENIRWRRFIEHGGAIMTFDEKLEVTKKSEQYPKQKNEHNALDDARWNFELYNFIQKLK